MRNIQKLLIGVFIGGVLLGGVGTGIAFVEYSSFSYGGEKLLGEEHLVTREFDYSFQPEQGRVLVGRGWWGTSPDSVEADETVPRGTVRYAVTYNDKTVEPYLIYEENTDPYSHMQGALDIGTHRVSSDFALWMECKDEVLADLKRHRISSYDVAYITDVKIKANPETLPYLLDEAELTEYH